MHIPTKVWYVYTLVESLDYGKELNESQFFDRIILAELGLLALQSQSRQKHLGFRNAEKSGSESSSKLQQHPQRLEVLLAVDSFEYWLLLLLSCFPQRTPNLVDTWDRYCSASLRAISTDTVNETRGCIFQRPQGIHRRDI